jgi:anti-anti-sigma regulatory factor
MLKIGRTENNGLAIFTLSGRIEEEHVLELTRLLNSERETRNVTLDLEEVRLVDRQVVGFLANCEARGIRLKNCPPYVREWMGKRSTKP